MRLFRIVALACAAVFGAVGNIHAQTAQPVLPGALSLLGCPSTVLTPCFVPSVPANPTSTLTRPANTTAYSSGQLIASSTIAGSVSVPSFTLPGGRGFVPRIRLSTSATTGWGGSAVVTVTLWRTAPTYTNGDGGAYAVATGASGRLGQFSCTLVQYGDGASGECSPSVGNFLTIALPSGVSVYWDVQAAASLTPISGQTFTLTPETVAD